jgi:ABC-type glycerol-3-phosphate transport system permease component
MGNRRAPAWVYLAAIALALISLFPFAWMLISSFKELRELYSVPPTWWPDRPTLENYAKVLFRSNIPRYFLNSTIISLGATALALAVAIFSAYGFARFRFRGRGALQTSVLATQMLPTAVIIVPLFIVLQRLGPTEHAPRPHPRLLILTLPLCVYMLTGYFRTIPIELDEAAIIDGASRLTVLFRITLPLSLPGIAATIVYCFVTTWNEFIFALSFALDSRVKTLPIGLAEFTTEFATDWGAVMAASVLMTLPIAVLFMALQRYFVGGLTAGATKG